MRMILTYGLAGALLAGSVFAVPAPVLAQDLRIELGESGPRVRVEDRDRRGDRYDRRDDRRDRGCSEGRALDKAERMGVRRARIDRIGRRTIEVRGRDRRGDRVSVVFGRERGCPVL
jgi:hypothetical protein